MPVPVFVRPRPAVASPRPPPIVSVFVGTLNVVIESSWPAPVPRSRLLVAMKFTLPPKATGLLAGSTRPGTRLSKAASVTVKRPVPRAEALPMSSSPAVTRVPPEWVLVPLSSRAPLPSFARPRAPKPKYVFSTGPE